MPQFAQDISLLVLTLATAEKFPIALLRDIDVNEAHIFGYTLQAYRVFLQTLLLRLYSLQTAHEHILHMCRHHDQEEDNLLHVSVGFVDEEIFFEQLLCLYELLRWAYLLHTRNKMRDSDFRHKKNRHFLEEFLLF